MSINLKYKHLQPVFDALTEAGVKFELHEGKNHPKIKFTHPHTGKNLQYTAPGTPSDHRSVKNCVSDVKRLLGGMAFEKIGYSHYQIKNGTIIARIPLTRALMLRWFGTDVPNDTTRVDIFLNKPTRELTLSPSPGGRYKINKVVSNPVKYDAFCTCLTISTIILEMPAYKRNRIELVCEKWLANNAVVFKLPEYLFHKPGWEATQEIDTIDKKLEEQAALEEKAKQEELAAAKRANYDEHRTVLEMLNDLLKQDKTLTAQCTEDGKRVSLIKVIE